MKQEMKEETSFIEFLNLEYMMGGKKPSFSPTKLLSKFVEYVKKCQENPFLKAEVKVVDKEVEHISIPKARMATVEGFCLFAGLSKENFYRYANGTHGKGKYKEVCHQIVEAVNQLRGGQAAADLLNANFVARLMGLSDKMDVNNINYNVEVTKDEMKNLSKELDNEL